MQPCGTRVLQGQAWGDSPQTVGTESYSVGGQEIHEKNVTENQVKQFGDQPAVDHSAECRAVVCKNQNPFVPLCTVRASSVDLFALQVYCCLSKMRRGLDLMGFKINLSKCFAMMGVGISCLQSPRQLPLVCSGTDKIKADFRQAGTVAWDRHRFHGCLFGKH